MKPLEGRIAVVTGGGRGIGRAIALRLARDGATVIVSSRTREELEQVVAQIHEEGGEALAVVCDALDRAGAREPVTTAIARFGRIDILVNNVGGMVGTHDLFEGGDDGFEATMVLNVTSAWWTTSAALPAMREARYGRIVNIGSTESLHANAGCPPAYVAGKHALAGFTKQVAQDTGRHGITANCICPGWTNTSMVDFDEIGAHMGVPAAEARAYAEAQSAQNCILEPEDIAAMAAFLVSKEGAHITGQVISVDAGYRL